MFLFLPVLFNTLEPWDTGLRTIITSPPEIGQGPYEDCTLHRFPRISLWIERHMDFLLS